MVETNDEWITSRTGIKERRILKEEGKGTSFLAIKAAEDLIQKKGLDPKEIELVIVCTATPDMKAAATASYTATQIGAVNAFSYDLEAACSSFLFGMSTAAAYIESGRYKKILLIGADKNSSFINYKDRATCIIFGDGAGAVLFEPNEEGLGLQDELLRSNVTEDTFKEGKHYIFQDGKTVFKNAVFNMADVTEKILKRNNLKNDDIAWLAAHQANKRIIDATANRINLEEEKVMMNIQRYGNTTSATLPMYIIRIDAMHRL
ncbi:UNVERIFIED_CONTAM: hypothetical protein GTU68_041138 [Idotea baltica]|nr:hypothetical protein [Idotea baltica]